MANTAAIFERMIVPHAGDLLPEHARYVLALDFTTAEHARYESLAAKASNGSLNSEEREELDAFLDASTVLMLMQSKARQSLRQSGTAA
jgi:hypothetical protein